MTPSAFGQGSDIYDPANYPFLRVKSERVAISSGPSRMPVAVGGGNKPSSPLAARDVG
jgi:hypothetical protein